MSPAMFAVLESPICHPLRTQSVSDSPQPKARDNPDKIMAAEIAQQIFEAHPESIHQALAALRKGRPVRFIANIEP